jgi:hypothetical protein
MKTGLNKIFFTCITGMLMLGCKEIYNPPEIRQNPGLLVVDGSLHLGNDSSVIKLSRSRNLDSLSSVPELNAKIILLDPSGQSYPLTEQPGGRYATDHLDLNYNDAYQLKINTADGREYLSDAFHAIQTPVIDSISWRQDSVGVSIYAYSNDPQNDSRYYRWDYTETWKYRTAVQSLFDYVNGQVVYRTPENQIYNCWSNFNSSDILVETTTKLSSNTINQKLIASIPRGSEKLGLRYSIIVNQYAISADAYYYWQNLKKNTEQLGTLFDAQPSQLVGNIHCVTNADEPVLGYVSASPVARKRIFIDAIEIDQWYYRSYTIECGQPGTGMVIPPSAADRYILGPKHLWVLVGTTMTGDFEIVQLFCGDCREHGGSNVQPDFWQ